MNNKTNGTDGTNGILKLAAHPGDKNLEPIFRELRKMKRRAQRDGVSITFKFKDKEVKLC